jgi:glycogen(starch) synthase
LRIALLTNAAMPAREGIGRHVTEIGRRLRARGHGVVVLARGQSFAGWRESEADGLLIRHYPFHPIQPLHQVAAGFVLRRWLEAGADGADLIHAHLPLLPPLPTRLPIIATFHSPMLADTAAITEPGLRPRLIRANARLFSRGYEQWHIDHAAAVVAVAPSVARELKAGYRMNGREPMVIENGVDTEAFAFHGEGRREPTLLYVGRLGYRKGLPRLLAAFALLRPIHPELRLALVGEGPLDASLRAEAASLGIADRVTFRGHLSPDGVRGQLRRAACLVNPADYESGPLTLLEAMAAGTPVVSTATGLVGAMGPDPPLLVAAADAAALAGAIGAILADPDAALRRARAARGLVERRFGWDRAVDRLCALYDAAARRAA